jgi:acyl-CoA thioesterase
MDKLALAKASAAAMWQHDLAAQALGMSIATVAPGAATLAMAVRPDMCNGHKICHGGMIFTLADTAFAYACNSHNRVTVASNCTVTFVAPAKAGDNLTAVAEERHRGGRSGVCDVTVTDQTGRLIAVFRGHSTELKGTLIEDPPPPRAARGGG